MVASKPNVVATAAIRNHKVNGGGHPQRPTDIDHNPDVIPGGNAGLMHHVSIHGPGNRQLSDCCIICLPLPYCF